MIELTYPQAAVAALILVGVGWLLCYYVWAWIVDAWARATSSAAYWADKASKLIGAVVIVGGACWLLWLFAANR